MNPYESEPVAKLYTRPEALYQFMVEQLKSELALSAPLSRVLDVGCGTGISSLALVNGEVAESVVGIDAAAEMINEAKPHPKVNYKTCPAESLLFAENSFDLVTVFVAFHFFDQATFLKEAARVLKDEGKLYITYTCFRCLNTESFNQWYKERFSTQYPAAKAKRSIELDSLATDELASPSYYSVMQKTPVTKAELIDLMMTMSGPCKAIIEGEKPEAIKAWLADELTQFFASETEQLPFHWEVRTWQVSRVPRLALEETKAERWASAKAKISRLGMYGSASDVARDCGTQYEAEAPKSP